MQYTRLLLKSYVRWIGCSLLRLFLTAKHKSAQNVPKTDFMGFRGRIFCWRVHKVISGISLWQTTGSKNGATHRLQTSNSLLCLFSEVTEVDLTRMQIKLK